MLDGTKVLWPEKESYYQLMVMKERDGAVSFNSEKQNQPYNAEDAIFSENDFYMWDKTFDSPEHVIQSFEGIKLAGACDPSLGKSDYSAIVTLARTSDGTFYVLDADIAKRSPEQLMNDVVAYCRKRRYDGFVFEANQFQGVMVDQIIKRVNQEGIYVPLKKITNTTNKIARIMQLQALVRQGTIQFCSKHKLLLEQMMYFPQAKHDDGPDALEMAVRAFKEFNLDNDYVYYFVGHDDLDD